MICSSLFAALLFFICSVPLFYLQRSFFYICSGSLFCLQRSLFLFAAFLFFVCSVFFVVCLQRFFFVCSVSFLFAAVLSICSVSLLGHRRERTSLKGPAGEAIFRQAKQTWRIEIHQSQPLAWPFELVVHLHKIDMRQTPVCSGFDWIISKSMDLWLTSWTPQPRLCLVGSLRV